MDKRDFEFLLARAISGNSEAFVELMELYMPLINRHSVIDGVFDEDCKQYILLQIALNISKFRI